MTETDALIARLRLLAERLDDADPTLGATESCSDALVCDEAADEIKRLERELAHTRKLLDAIRPAAETSTGLLSAKPCADEAYKIIMARIEGLMNATGGSPEGEELHLLGDLAVFYERQLGFERATVKKGIEK